MKLIVLGFAIAGTVTFGKGDVIAYNNDRDAPERFTDVDASERFTDRDAPERFTDRDAPERFTDVN